jgi:hypothetical protein
MTRAKRGPSGIACLSALLLLALAAGCDTAGVPPVLDAAPPAVSPLALSPSEADLDALPEGSDIALRLGLSVAEGSAPVARVAYAVQWQFACSSSTLDASGTMEPTGEGGAYAAEVALPAHRGRRGAYRVTAWAVDASGRASSPAVGTFTLRGANAGPPVIASVEAPAVLRVPARGGAVPLRFVVTVTDPDGVEDIARAEVVTPGLGTVPLAETEGGFNPTPCNGVYSTTFSIPAGIGSGELPFAFRAYDRAGAASAETPFTVRIEGGT